MLLIPVIAVTDTWDVFADNGSDILFVIILAQK